MTARLPTGGEEADPTVAQLLGELRERGYVHEQLFRTLGKAPAMARIWREFAWALRERPAVSRALRELAIMRVAQLHRCAYEWGHHWRMSLREGLTEDKLRALRDWERSGVFEPLERAVLAYTDAMVAGDVPDEAFAPVRESLGDAEIVELTLTIATYIGLARFFAALQVDVDADVRAFADVM